MPPYPMTESYYGPPACPHEDETYDMDDEQYSYSSCNDSDAIYYEFDGEDS